MVSTMQVRQCSKRYAHDWTICPVRLSRQALSLNAIKTESSRWHMSTDACSIDMQYAHPGEKARRRDPKIHTYDGVACPDMKKVQSQQIPYQSLKARGCSVAIHCCAFKKRDEDMLATAISMSVSFLITHHFYLGHHS